MGVLTQGTGTRRPCRGRIPFKPVSKTSCMYYHFGESLDKTEHLTRDTSMRRALAEELYVEPNAVFGHSFGGKIAIKYLEEAQRQAWTIPDQVWVLDSLPGTGTKVFRSWHSVAVYSTLWLVVVG
jgi:pimeloyl-ACP methyl ester carboxylesterase